MAESRFAISNQRDVKQRTAKENSKNQNTLKATQTWLKNLAATEWKVNQKIEEYQNFKTYSCPY